MAGRPKGSGKGVVMGEEHRLKIQKSNVLSRLIKHAESETGIMENSQVTAALGLLNFAIPKLQAIDPNTGTSTINLKVTIGGDD